MIGFYPYIFGSSSNNNDKILSYGDFYRLENDFHFLVGFSWKINNAIYANTNEIVINIPVASQNNHRTDLFVLTENNTIIRIAGDEFPTSSMTPKIPANTLLIFSVDIIGEFISTPYSPNGVNMLFVRGNGRPGENFHELQLAITLASSLARSENKYVIMVNSGKYIDESEDNLYIESREYVSIISISQQPDVILDLKMRNGNCTILGIKANRPISFGDYLENTNFINCISDQDYSFNITPDSVNCTFENCIGSNFSFGYRLDSIASGRYINCRAGNYSFGGAGTANGYFENCNAGNYSFGSSDHDSVITGNCIGTFKNCSAFDYSFGYNSNCNATFENCVAGDYSFGFIENEGDYRNTSTFINCTAGDNSFGKLRNDGKYYNCKLTGRFNYKTNDNLNYKYYNCIEENLSIGNLPKNILQTTGYSNYSLNRFDEITNVVSGTTIVKLDQHTPQSNGETRIFLLDNTSNSIEFQAPTNFINGNTSFNVPSKDEDIEHYCLTIIWTGTTWIVQSLI